MKSIAFDARMHDHPGIGRYIRELLGAFSLNPPSKKMTLIGAQALQNIPKLQTVFNFLLSKAPIYSLREQWDMCIKGSSFNLLHVPHFNIPVFFSKKLVVTVHDLIYLHERSASKSRWGASYVKFLFKKIESKADAVIAVSEYTKNDLIHYFPHLKSRVFVTHEACADSFKKMQSQELEQAIIKYGLRKPFVLFVGTLKPHKNVSSLIRAMKNLNENKKIDHELILIGRKDQRSKDILTEIKGNSFVRYLGELSDIDICSLYNLAQVFVLPSLYEGFGLPLVEAMACGAPVISSNRASLPEVLGDAGPSFDPSNVDALEALLYNVLNDEELRNNMSIKSLEQAKKFSWAKTAEATCQVYNQVLS